jgi:S-adenosylmethionine hydrolase
MPTPIITLTTDFGLSDGYVAAIKGVILSRMPEAVIVDLCHAIPPQDIGQAAYVLKDTFACFPNGTIHVVVVDPGVGSGREIIAVSCHGHCFLAPDNGVLGLVVSAGAKVYRAQRPDLYREPVSRTFHGRDIFAPLAAHLAAGHPVESIGPAILRESLTALQLPLPLVDRQGRTVSGCVIRIDHFGNLITNISRAEIDQLGVNPEATGLTIGRHAIHAWYQNYSQAPADQFLLLINSSSQIEIAINRGHAANRLNLGIYAPVILSVC